MRPLLFAVLLIAFSLEADADVIWSQPHDGSGTLNQSSGNGMDYDQFVWDNFTLGADRDITDIQWRGGYLIPPLYPSGAIVDFTVSIWSTTAGGPSVGGLPLALYENVPSNETPAGTFGGVAMYDYSVSLSTAPFTPFHAVAGTEYWVEIAAFQPGVPGWGIAAGSGGDGSHFMSFVNYAGGTAYRSVAGDAAITLLRPAGGTTTTTAPPATTTTTSTTTSSTVPATTTTSTTTATTVSTTTTTTTVPATTTTTTVLATTTTSSPPATTTTTTLPVGLIPGGGPTTSDCYIEVAVQGIANPSVRVQANKKVVVTDGDVGDQGPCGDEKCRIRAAVCINQVDPNLQDCAAPAALDKATVKGKVSITVPQILAGARCGAFLDVEVPAKVKRNKAGNVTSAKAGTVKLSLSATAPKGAKPRSDKDTVTFVCVPRTVACP